jgi:Bacterial low temperature requirement A protein (LtrA)
MRGLRISPEHFIERFGLIIIIALGESIVAIGVGAAGLSLDAGVIAAASRWPRACGGRISTGSSTSRRRGLPTPERSAQPSPETPTRACTCRWWGRRAVRFRFQDDTRRRGRLAPERPGSWPLWWDRAVLTGPRGLASADRRWLRARPMAATLVLLGLSPWRPWCRRSSRSAL